VQEEAVVVSCLERRILPIRGRRVGSEDTMFAVEGTRLSSLDEHVLCNNTSDTNKSETI
jgi:hypothetical protein